MSFNELIVLMVIALVLFGPEDLPDVARAVGKVVFEIKKIAGDMTKEFQDVVNTPSNALKKTLDETLKTPTTTPKKSSQADMQGSTGASTTVATDNSETTNPTPGENDTSEEELLTYDEDPLAELPQDMVSHEK
ncbi:MAG: twin-arginine translocase TatA/TatE family subunit [Desulfitobacterium sp.]